MKNKAKLKYGNSEALLEYMLNGENVSILEAILYLVFKVQIEHSLHLKEKVF